MIPRGFCTLRNERGAATSLMNGFRAGVQLQISPVLISKILAIRQTKLENSNGDKLGYVHAERHFPSPPSLIDCIEQLVDQ